MERIYSSSLLPVELRIWCRPNGAVVVYSMTAASFVVWNGLVARVWIGGYNVLVKWLEDSLYGGEMVAMDLPRRVGDLVDSPDSRARCL
jgi:hypothetical protein